MDHHVHKARMFSVLLTKVLFHILNNYTENFTVMMMRRIQASQKLPSDKKLNEVLRLDEVLSEMRAGFYKKKFMRPQKCEGVSSGMSAA